MRKPEEVFAELKMAEAYYRAAANVTKLKRQEYEDASVESRKARRKVVSLKLELLQAKLEVERGEV